MGKREDVRHFGQKDFCKVHAARLQLSFRARKKRLDCLTNLDQRTVCPVVYSRETVRDRFLSAAAFPTYLLQCRTGVAGEFFEVTVIGISKFIRRLIHEPKCKIGFMHNELQVSFPIAILDFDKDARCVVNAGETLVKLLISVHFFAPQKIDPQRVAAESIKLHRINIFRRNPRIVRCLFSMYGLELGL